MHLPFIVLNPRDDPTFAALVGSVLDEGIADAEAMEARLRARYPDAVVRERGLSHEPAVWYVYRDGTWVPTGTSVAPRVDDSASDDDGATGDDVRATAEDLVATADTFDDIEAAKAELDVDDPRSLELAEQATELAREMAVKAELQERLIRDHQENDPSAADDGSGERADPPA